MHSIFALALCLASAYSNSITAKPILFDYDDLPSNPAAAQLNPVPKPYKGLNFNGFSVRADGASQLRSISPPNTISSTFVQQITSGSLANITSVYAGSNVTKFDFKSTFNGCNLFTGATTGLEQACTVQYTGFTTTGEQITRNCAFIGTSGNPKPLAFCDFQGALDGVTTVDILVANSQTLPATTVLVLDNTTIVEYVSSS